jgi:hypothetical protein
MVCSDPGFKAYYSNVLTEVGYATHSTQSMYDILLEQHVERMADRFAGSFEDFAGGRRLQSSEELEPYAGFMIFDLNSDGVLTPNEWTDSFENLPMSYDVMFAWFRDHAADLCFDPLAESGTEFESANNDIFGPLSDMYFSLDRNYDGSIDPSEF